MRTCVCLALLLAGCDSSSDTQPNPKPDAATHGDDATMPVDAAGLDASARPDAASSRDAATAASLRGTRYCEVLVIYLRDGGLEAQVWGTQGLNTCPADEWNALDSDDIRSELGATTIVLNGPRYWLIDAVPVSEIPDVPPRMFGALEMRQLATVSFTGTMIDPTPYTERIVNRTAVFSFFAGSEIYELLASNGSVYVMQSYAQITNQALTEGDLPALGEQLELPDGWRYRARTLNEPLRVETLGEAHVVQDELQNTYSRHIEGGASD